MMDELLDDNNDVVVGGSGKRFRFEVLNAETDLSHHPPIADLLDIKMLPAAIGGDATSFDESGGADEHYSRGVAHPSVMEFSEDLGRAL